MTWEYSSFQVLLPGKGTMSHQELPVEWQAIWRREFAIAGNHFRSGTQNGRSRGFLRTHFDNRLMSPSEGLYHQNCHLRIPIPFVPLIELPFFDDGLELGEFPRSARECFCGTIRFTSRINPKEFELTNHLELLMLRKHVSRKFCGVMCGGGFAYRHHLIIFQVIPNSECRLRARDGLYILDKTC